MGAHLRANLVLLLLTVMLCCVIYPGILWLVGQVFFHSQAEGSLIYAADGKTVVGSHLIGQNFSGDYYFWPRPSAAGAGYDASASGGSNLASSNPKLRGRVAQTLGPIVRYGDGRPVGPDIDAWFATTDGLTARWANECPTLAGEWAKNEPAKTYLPTWWSDQHAGEEKKLEEVASDFLADFAAHHPRGWPIIEETKKDGQSTFTVQSVSSGKEVQSIFFDFWLRAHPDKLAEIEPVPADMVLASGSGLDPHITLKNARYQLPRVAAARARLSIEKSAGRPGTPAELQRLEANFTELIEARLKVAAFRPLAGLAGDEPLVNVLELNLAIDAQLERAQR